MTNLTKQICLIFTLLFFCKIASAQWATANEEMNINNISALFQNGGDMFWDLVATPHYEYPAHSGKNTIFASSLWIGGMDKDKKLYTAAMTYRQSGMDFFPGPLDSNGRISDTLHPAYDKIWRIDKQTLYDFMDHPDTVPPAIKFWPGNGDVKNGFSKNLAPYVDYNKNGKYDPDDGDYPLFYGDKAFWWVFNDNTINQPKMETKSDAMQIEVQAQAYAYSTNMPPLGNTIFVSYKIINRSNVDYDSVFIGQWTDFDIGDGFNDYIGSDSVLNMFFGYNDTTIDAVYGKDVPVQAVVFLDHKMKFFRYYQNDFSINGNPMETSHYYYYLSGRDKNGDCQMNLQNGDCKAFMYQGEPYDVASESEVQLQNKSGDRRGIGSIGPFNLKSKDAINFTLAFVTTGSLGSTQLNYAQLRNDVATIKDIYNQRRPTGIKHNKLLEQQILIYPVPASDFLYIKSEIASPNKITILDITGRIMLVNTVSGQTKIDVSTLLPGIYIVEVENKNGVQFRKIEIRK